MYTATCLVLATPDMVDELALYSFRAMPDKRVDIRIDKVRGRAGTLCFASANFRCQAQASSMAARPHRSAAKRCSALCSGHQAMTRSGPLQPHPAARSR